MQRVSPDIGDAFGPVEQALQKTFLLDLFQGLGEGKPGRGVTRLPVKQAGLALPDPTKTAPEDWKTSCVIIGHLVASLRVQEELWTVDHSSCLQEESTAVCKQSVLLEEDAMVDTSAGPCYEVHVNCDRQQRREHG